MWQVIKAELKYNRLSFLILSIMIISLQGIEILQKVVNPEHIFINSSNIMFLVFFFFIISIFQKRMRGDIIRFHSLLPLSNAKVAKIRFTNALIPFIFLLFYFIVSHFIVLFAWDVFTEIPFGQVGLTIFVLACIYSTSDSWCSDSNLGKRVENMLFPILILIILLLAVYYISQAFLKSIIIVRILEILSIFIGVTALRTTIQSFIKRKSYLN